MSFSVMDRPRTRQSPSSVAERRKSKRRLQVQLAILSRKLQALNHLRLSLSAELSSCKPACDGSTLLSPLRTIFGQPARRTLSTIHWTVETRTPGITGHHSNKSTFL